MPFGIDDALLIGSVAAPALGGLLGNLFGSGDRDEAHRLQQQALAQLQGISPEQFAALQAQTIGQTNLNGIQGDPATRGAEMQALQSLISEGQSGGLTAQDRAAMNDAENEVSTVDRGRRGALENAFASRGMGGGGGEIAAELAGQQQGSEALHNAGMGAAGAASQRALQSMMAAGQLGGAVRSQDYGIASDRARAQDSINAANANILNNMGQFNAQMSNNVWQNNAGLAQAKANAMSGQAANLLGQSAQTQQMWGGVGQGVGEGAGAVAGYDQRQQYLDYLKQHPNTSGNPFGGGYP